MKRILYAGFAALLGLAAAGTAAACGGAGGVTLQVLGSGGPELRSDRASSGYLVWRNGRAVVLVDAGGGTALRFGEAGARFADLAGVLFTHLHADHNSDFPALVKSSFFEGRGQDLPVHGPAGNALLPPVDRYLHLAFGDEGAYPYLSDMLEDRGGWKLEPVVVVPGAEGIWSAELAEGVRISAVRVEHGPLPALAWRLDIDGRSITFSGDMNGRLGSLEKLAAGSDLLVAHHAIAEDSRDAVARRLHMPPSEIGRIAAEASVGRVVLSHVMQRTEGRFEESIEAIREHYDGPVDVAVDLACYPLR